MKYIKLFEEYINSSKKLLGYHVTLNEKINSIKNNGFNVGNRSMQGKGFYAFYEKSHAIRYLTKDNSYVNSCIIVFQITKPKNLLYLNIDIAKQVLGNDYHLINQIENYYSFKGGLKYFFELVQSVTTIKTIDELKNVLNEIENNNTEDNQRKLIFNMIPFEENNKLNICWNGNYGIEYRLSHPKLLTFPIGYFIIDNKYNESNIIEFDYKIPNTKEYSDLIEFKSENKNLNLIDLKDKAENLQYRARNNNDYNYYGNIYNLINKIIIKQ